MTHRVGTVPYIVSWPLLEDLASETVEVIAEVPAKLIADLRGGNLDVALASTIELFRSPGTRAIRNIGIVAEHEVMSVALFSRVPFEQIRSVAMDPASRTAEALTRILLSERGDGAEIVTTDPGEHPAGKNCDAFLLIGDPALRLVAGRDPFPGGYEIVLDLATLWRERTGLPFTFAVWLVAPDRDLGDLPEKLMAAAAHGSSRMDTIAKRAARHTGQDEAIVDRYLRQVCSYDLNAPGVLDGMNLFAEKAARHGLALPDARVEFY